MKKQAPSQQKPPTEKTPVRQHKQLAMPTPQKSAVTKKSK